MVLPSILLSTALCRSGFCRARRFLSSLAHTMKAFMGLRILCSLAAAFPSTDTPPVWLRSGLCPPEVGVREILGSPLLMVPGPRPSGELQSPERFCSKPISEPEAGLGVLEVQGPPRDTRPGCRRVSLDKLDSVKFIPELGSDSTFSQTSVSVCWVVKFWPSVGDDTEEDLEWKHEAQSTAWRCERRKKERTNTMWCRIFLSCSVHSSVLRPSVRPSVRPSHSLSLRLSAPLQSFETCGQI